jgi:Na+-transporting NADH:ubiquinone oxidoreductase subunit NqrB
LAWGTLGLGFDVSPARIALVVGTALAAQWLCVRRWRVGRFDPRSPLISALSLCLLLRTDVAALAAAGAVIAVVSKFVLCWRDKHVFNPTNLALVALMLATERVWISPGQWGHAAWLAFLLVCGGSAVIRRASRSDVTWALLFSWTAILFARAAWLGDPWAIPLHQLQSGGLLIFTFFMISDPRTTPDSRAGRILFAVLVALGGAFVDFRLWQQNGLVWSLAALSPLVPLLDRLLPGGRFTWEAARRSLPATASLGLPAALARHGVIR